MNQDKLLSLLKPEAQKINQAMEQDLEIIDNQLLNDVIQYAIFNGGKRVRPLLTVLSARLCSQSDTPSTRVDRTEDLYKLSLTFEYLHAASLLHDDVIDHADKRRGKKAANRVWDNSHVILAGDFLHTRAMLLAGTIGGSYALQIICQATSSMVESEFLQLQNAERLDTSSKNYFKVLHGKTASLIAAACQTGAIFSAASEKENKALHLFGANLGLTFQIADDLLDYLGNPQKTGKAVGNDFQERKMTLPLIHALENAKESDRQRLNNLLAADQATRNAALPEARQIIADSGGFDYARQYATNLIAEALESLTIFNDGPDKEILIALAQYVLNRDK